MKVDRIFLHTAVGQPGSIRWPKGLATQLEQAVATLRLVERTGATVQDSAEVAAVLYDLTMAIPNLPPRLIPGEWGELDEEAVEEDEEAEKEPQDLTHSQLDIVREPFGKRRAVDPDDETEAD